MKQRREGNVQGAARNGAFWNMMGSGIMAANTVLLTMLAGHYTSLEEVGIFTLSLTTAQVLYAVGLFGVNDLQMVDYARRYAFRNYFWAKIVSTAAAVILCICAVRFLGFGQKACLYTFLLTAFMLVNSFAELYQSLYFQNQRLDLSGKSLFFRYLFATLAFILCLLAGGTMPAACVAMLAVDLAVTAYWIRRYAPVFRDSGYGFESASTGRLLREAFPLAVSVLASLILMNAPKYLIYLFVSDEVQGAYTLLFMPVYAVNLLSQFVFKPFLHRYSLMLHGKEKGFGRLFASHFLVIWATALGGAVFLWLAGSLMMKILFGQDLSGYRNMMFLFMLSGGFLALNQLMYYFMVILKKQRAVLISYLVSAGISVPAGVLLIPRMAIGGAWAAFTIGQIILTAGYGLTLLHKRGEPAGDGVTDDAA